MLGAFVGIVLQVSQSVQHRKGQGRLQVHLQIPLGLVQAGRGQHDPIRDRLAGAHLAGSGGDLLRGVVVHRRRQFHRIPKAGVRAAFPPELQHHARLALPLHADDLLQRPLQPRPLSGPDGNGVDGVSHDGSALHLQPNRGLHRPVGVVVDDGRQHRPVADGEEPGRHRTNHERQVHHQVGLCLAHARLRVHTSGFHLPRGQVVRHLKAERGPPVFVRLYDGFPERVVREVVPDVPLPTAATASFPSRRLLRGGLQDFLRFAENRRNGGNPKPSLGIEALAKGVEPLGAQGQHGFVHSRHGELGDHRPAVGVLRLQGVRHPLAGLQVIRTGRQDDVQELLLVAHLEFDVTDTGAGHALRSVSIPLHRHHRDEDIGCVRLADGDFDYRAVGGKSAAEHIDDPAPLHRDQSLHRFLVRRHHHDPGRVTGAVFLPVGHHPEQVVVPARPGNIAFPRHPDVELAGGDPALVVRRLHFHQVAPGVRESENMGKFAVSAGLQGLGDHRLLHHLRLPVHGAVGLLPDVVPFLLRDGDGKRLACQNLPRVVHGDEIESAFLADGVDVRPGRDAHVVGAFVDSCRCPAGGEKPVAPLHVELHHQPLGRQGLSDVGGNRDGEVPLGIGGAFPVRQRPVPRFLAAPEPVPEPRLLEVVVGAHFRCGAAPGERRIVGHGVPLHVGVAHGAAEEIGCPQADFRRLSLEIVTLVGFHVELELRLPVLRHHERLRVHIVLP